MKLSDLYDSNEFDLFDEGKHQNEDYMKNREIEHSINRNLISTF